MPDSKSKNDQSGSAPQPANAGKTLRLADIKARAAGKEAIKATPAIKPVKTLMALPVRPAPESRPEKPNKQATTASAKTPTRKPASSTKISNPVDTKSTPSPPTSSSNKEVAIRPAPSKKVRPAPRPPSEIPRNDPNSSDSLTETTLPKAVGDLFALNNFDVEYSKKIHGAEVDIVATPKGGGFGSTLYIEVTVQYVDNTKYGKDLTKFILVREKDRSCVCLSVSTTGFTPDVRERASESNITLRTYSELFSQFEKFSSYVESTLSNPDIITLANAYEEPYFRDERGEHLAPPWLGEWLTTSTATTNWLVVLGEYGTGKTALTLKLQYDWLKKYQQSAANPIPLRIELRNFVRQFDARSLLHHFLDSNQLGHIPVDYLLHLIRSRRVILLLDGYDEMAQFLNARERRACLAALAELSGSGAKGILTSRPNYFTEAEELHVFDALYTSLEQSGYFVGQMDKVFFAQENSIDSLLERYLLNKNERYLRDLTPDQTTSLVRRKLANDPIGQNVVLDLLERVFREEIEGRRQSLGGKPVIISYLLELVDFLSAEKDDQKSASLSEWQIYKLIVDRLMMRDLHRSPTMPPEKRREALQKLALQLSTKSTQGATETIFYSLVDDLFRADLRRLTPEEQRLKRDELFQDLRSSSTLTRAERATPSVWHFSHNSLREFLVAEMIVGSMCLGRPLDINVPISRAMRSFIAALPEEPANQYLNALEGCWQRRSTPSLGNYFSAAFDLLRSRDGGLRRNLSRLMRSTEGRLEINDISLRDVEFSLTEVGSSVQAMCGGSTLTDITFRGLDLAGSNFESTTFDRCSFIDCNLNNCSFKAALLFECNFNRVTLEDCDFSLLDLDSNIVAANREGEPIVLSGRSAIGFFKYHGAITDAVSSFHELQHHPRFPIVQKICERISEQRNSQLRGLTQRGAAQVDPPFARDFMDCLVKAGLVEIDGNNLVSVTTAGRRDLPRLLSHDELPSSIEAFLQQRR